MATKPVYEDGQRGLRWYAGVLLALSASVILGAWGVLGSRATLPAIRLLGSVVGLAPGVFHRYGEKSAHLPNWHRHLLLVAIPVLTAVVAAIPWLLPHLYFEHHPKDGPPYCTVGIPACVIITPVAMACVWVKPPPSVYIRDAIRCVLSYWLIVLLWQVYATAMAPLFVWHGSSSIYYYAQEFYRSALLHFEGLVIFGWTAWMMVRRVRALEDGSSMATQHAGTLVCSMAAAFQGASWVITLFDSYSSHPVKIWLYVVFIAIFQGIWTFYTWVLARTLAKSVALVRREMFKVTGAPRAEAAWACRVLALELTATVLLGVTTPLTWSAVALQDLWRSYNKGDVPVLRVGTFAVHRADLFLNAVTVAVLSGLLGQVGKPRLDEEHSSGDLWNAAASREDSMLSGRSDLSAASPEEWAQKVEELAGRGVQIGDLLGLWTRLLAEPGLMPGFDPRQSTTNDVVRRVVIPLSRDGAPFGGGRALASVWSGGNPREARCMVTHNWSNLFWHLVAAIVADCAGEDEYSGTAEKLLSEEGVEEVRKTLEAKGAMGQTYWVCAFSINQHAGICNGFGPPPHPDDPERLEWEGKRRDTATQRVHPLCSCEQRKVLNNEAALCEMNKFDDMMRLLSTRVERFSHLVVVDAQFDVFQRAWCVAEIVESHRSGIPQHIMIHSQEVLDLHYLSLSALDVRDCKASRKEDRDMILAGIADIDRFNCELQWAIFGTKGLFKKWVDGQERSALIGRIVRRAQTGESGAPRQASRRLTGCLSNAGSADGGKAADLLEEGSPQGPQPAQSRAATATGEPSEEGGPDLESCDAASTRRPSES